MIAFSNKMSADKDNQVLNLMFDPYLVEYNLENSCYSVQTPGPDEDDDDFQDLSQEQLESKKLELKAIESSDQAEHQKALEYYEQALKLWPENASAFNNRAQTFRLLNRVSEAEADLDQAIRLSMQENPHGNDNKRSRQKREFVARQAYCQRGLIHLLNNDRDNGLKDMSKAADLGNRFARSFVAKMNPYAALCNQMLQKMFEPYTGKK